MARVPAQVDRQDIEIAFGHRNIVSAKHMPRAYGRPHSPQVRRHVACLGQPLLNCGLVLERRVAGIKGALSAWELYGAAAPSPADWLTCGSADSLTVRDRDCPRWLLLTGT